VAKFVRVQRDQPKGEVKKSLLK